MRIIRWMHFGYIVLLVLMDNIGNAVLGSVLPTSIVFVSNLSFLGLLLLTQNESPTESIIKAGLLGIWMDLNHVGTFPMFFSAYTLTILTVRIWDRYMGTSALEFIVVSVIALFIKELILYFEIITFKHVSLGLMSYISIRTFWVIILNILMIPIVRYLYKQMHRLIMKRAQNLYIR